jgi:hypothetical protein
LTTEPLRKFGPAIARAAAPETIPAKFADVQSLEAWLSDPGDGDGPAGVLLPYVESDIDRPIRFDLSAAREAIASSPGTTAWQVYALTRVDNNSAKPGARAVVLERLAVGTFTHTDDGGVVFTAAEAGDAEGSGYRTPTAVEITTEDGVLEARSGRAVKAVEPVVGIPTVSGYDVGPHLGIVLLLSCEGEDTLRALVRRWA